MMFCTTAGKSFGVRRLDAAFPTDSPRSRNPDQPNRKQSVYAVVATKAVSTLTDAVATLCGIFRCCANIESML